MSFCTAINCMDGRVQLSVNKYLTDRFGVKYVDTITGPGPDGILAMRNRPDLVESILNCVQISLEAHDSVGIAVSGHWDCAGNPVDKATHMRHTRESVRFLRTRIDCVDIVGLWVDSNWTCHEIVTCTTKEPCACDACSTL